MTQVVSEFRMDRLAGVMALEMDIHSTRMVLVAFQFHKGLYYTSLSCSSSSVVMQTIQTINSDNEHCVYCAICLQLFGTITSTASSTRAHLLLGNSRPYCLRLNASKCKWRGYYWQPIGTYQHTIHRQLSTTYCLASPRYINLTDRHRHIVP